MSDIVAIAQGPTQVHPSWGRVVDRVGGPVVNAWVTCPAGHSGHLDHDIAADGTVWPSVQCPADGCSWHEYVRLVGWSYGMIHRRELQA